MRNVNFERKSAFFESDVAAKASLSIASESRASKFKSVVNNVSDIASVMPNASAVQTSVDELTYEQLQMRTDRLASYLRLHGADREMLVAVCLGRSIEQIVAVLAVLKCGAAFLPLDPAWPMERLAEVMADARPAILITDAGPNAEWTLSADWTTVRLDHDAEAIAQQAPIRPADIAAGDLAYVIYTSGSTGMPKGVEITHASLANLATWHIGTFAITLTDRTSHLASVGFDAAIWEVLPNLAAGACVCLPEDTVRASPELLQAWLVAQRIAVAFVPRVLAERLIALPWPVDTALRVLLTGAETLYDRPPPDLPFALVNNYGPTECAVVATSGTVRPSTPGGPGAPPSIGRPIANVTVGLLDDAGQPVPEGEVGEIAIGGAGVARGYRFRPDLTRQRFIADPDASGPAARLYRTGDLARRLPDGRLAFLGRNDDQIKLRGQRIEPAEIVRALNRHPSLAASAVDLRPGPDAESRLVAYVVPQPAACPSADDLHGFLAILLPPAMLPSEYVSMGQLPINSSGKLDRPALPEPSPDNLLARAVAKRAPETPAERRLAALVAQILWSDDLSVDDNFFAIGGHSLLGTQVVLRARDAFGVNLTLRHLFEAPTVASLAATVERLLAEELAQMTDEEAEMQLNA